MVQKVKIVRFDKFRIKKILPDKIMIVKTKCIVLHFKQNEKKKRNCLIFRS